MKPAVTPVLTLTLAFAAVSLSLGGCAATGPSARQTQGDGARPDMPPRDFAVSVAVRPNSGDLEPAWYILEADGTLRAALGAPTARSPIPPRIRTLTPGARATVWQAVEQAQWIPGPSDATRDASSEAGESTNATSNAAIQTSTELAEVYVAADGGRWSGRVLQAPGSPEADRLAAVIRELRQLAWLPVSD